MFTFDLTQKVSGEKTINAKVAISRNGKYGLTAFSEKTAVHLVLVFSICQLLGSVVPLAPSFSFCAIIDLTLVFSICQQFGSVVPLTLFSLICVKLEYLNTLVG